MTGSRPSETELVGAIYDSIVEPDAWVSTLQLLCDRFEGRMATLAVVDTITGNPRFSAACGPSEIVAPLMNEYGADVTFYSALPMMDVDHPFTVDSIYALQGPSARDKWLKSRIAREWVTPNGLDDFFWVVLMRQPTRVGSLLIVTDTDRRDISGSDLRRIARLSPHIRRAVTIGDLFEAERRETEVFRTIVENLTHPVMVVSREMAVLFANPQAQILLTDGTLVSSLRGQLLFHYGPANAAVARSVEIGVYDELALGPSGISVPLAAAQTPAVAHVMPLAQRSETARVCSRAAAAIFIAAAGSSPIPALDAFASLFGLTAAEKRVAGHVASGLSRAQIALSAGVSDGTVKSQLSAIFDKTGVGDQRELALLIRELSPPSKTQR